MSDSLLDGIAIVGVHGRFPGADSAEAFWANLIAGKETISFFTDDELREAGLDPVALRSAGQYVPARGVLKDADCFDAAFFGIHPKEAEVMDPQQRVFLEACWEALERAGYAPDRAPGVVGVFGGATFNTYYLHALQPRADLRELVGREQLMLGNEKDYLTTRVAYKLNLRGPAIGLDTACSSSLVAIAQASQSLLTYQCSMALAGGVSVRVPQTGGYYHQEGNIASGDGHTRSFDDAATGTVFSNGVAIVVLKRLDEALADSDEIYAVIKSSAVNNDGSRRVSFGAPGVEGQAEVISLAQEIAGVEPDSLSYIEAHGTATPIGDPIEVAALTKAFRRSTQRKQFCALGSVKTNIGHLDAASGAAGLIKTALALKHGLLPQTLHFRSPNPRLDLENSPFFVNTSLREWKTESGAPRRAGVSSFGTGGTNAHVILEEAPASPAGGPSRSHQLLILSAKTPGALEAMTRNLVDHLEKNPELDLADVAYTLQVGRSEFSYRRVIICKDRIEAITLLKTPEPRKVFTGRQEFKDPPVVFMFPGQGAQYVNMGAELYRQEHVFRETVDRCARILEPVLGTDLRKVIFVEAESEADASEQLRQTHYTQPALFVIEYALTQLWISWGIQPSSMIGHSVGEYVAGCLAGVFTLEDALALVARRAALVQAQPPGSMLAVRLGESDLVPLLHSSLSIAAVNSSNLCVVSGPTEAVNEFEKILSEKNIAAKRLHTSHAFHSAMMNPVVGPFGELVKNCPRSEPTIPFVSNVTGRWVTPAEAVDPEYWANHVRQAVRFADGLSLLLTKSKQVLIEIGPGQTLFQLARQHPQRKDEQLVLSTLGATHEQETFSIISTVGRLWLAGATIKWADFHSNARRRRVVLPTYPFERKRFWPEPLGGQAHEAMPAITPTTPERLPVADSSASSNLLITGFPNDTMNDVIPASDPMLPPSAPRKERLLGEARAILQDLSGTPLEGTDPSTNFLELGLDSLLLTQAAQLFAQKFGVAVSFRQLMEELASLDMVVAYLDKLMPPESAPAAISRPKTPAVLPSAVPASGLNAPVALTAPVGSLEQLLIQQIAITNQLLLGLVQRGGSGLTPAALPVPPTFLTAAAIASAPAQATPAPKPTTTIAPATEQKAFGPFRALETSASANALSADQRQFLDKLISEYTARTQKSKDHTQRFRKVLADPRTVAGFRPFWKEMVYPIVVERSRGSRMWDIDGNEYIDFSMGFGTNMLGHSPDFVISAIGDQLQKGIEVGPQSPLAGKVAQLMCELTGMERCAFANTGSEAVLAAIRVSRTVTGRKRIIFFAGDYHGIFDEVLQRSVGTGSTSRLLPIAPGIPTQSTEHLTILDFNRPESIEAIRALGSDVAAVIVEPVQSRHPDLQAREFLLALRQVTAEIGSALIFDEVITGFRSHPGGVQGLYGIQADLATYGKLIGGGVPIGAICGKARFMDALDGGFWSYGDNTIPEVGMTFFAGTYVRHPLSMAGAWAVLSHLKEKGPGLQQELADRMTAIVTELNAFLREKKAPLHLEHFRSFFWISFETGIKFGSLLFFLLRNKGIHIFEGRLFFLATTHTADERARLVQAFKESILEMQSVGFLPGGSPPPPPDQGNGPKRTDGPPSPLSPVNRRPLTVGEDKTISLTEAQRGLWSLSKRSPKANHAYTEFTTLRLRGPLNLDLLRNALQVVVDRHEGLRAIIDSTGNKQTIELKSGLSVPLTDLSTLDESERKSQLAEEFKKIETIETDFSKGPALGARVVRYDAETHFLVLLCHHAFGNGPSYSVIFEDFFSAYQALDQKLLPAFEPAFQLSDFVGWLEEQTKTPNFSTDRAFWLQQFADSIPILELPTDHPRPAALSFRGGRASLVIDSPTTSALRKVSGKLRSSLFVTLYAAFNVLLHRLTGQDDIVTGVPSEGPVRQLPGGKHLVANSTNLLPLRSRVSWDTPFAEVVAKTKSLVLESSEHQAYFFGNLISDLKVRHDASRSSIVAVSFNVERAMAAKQLGPLQASLVLPNAPFANPGGSSKFELAVNISDLGDSLHIDCDFYSDLFDAATVDRWLNHYRTLLTGITTDPTRAIRQLPILDEEEKKKILVTWNETAAAYPQEQTVQSLISAQAERTPQKIAVEFENDSVTYSALLSRANALAVALKSLGVGPNVLVGVFVERSVDLLVAVLGILQAGGAYVPLDPVFPKERLAYMTAESKLPVIVTQSRLKSELPQHQSKIVFVDEMADRKDRFPAPPSGASDLAYILFTSGSTGNPKGVQIHHRALTNFLYSMRRKPGFCSNDVLLAVTTLSFDIAGLEIFLPLICGGKVVIASRQIAVDGARLAQELTRRKITVMQATPMSWRLLLGAGWKGKSDLKILCGGEALPMDLARQLPKLCSELWNMYGPTETTIWSTCCRINGTEENIHIGGPIDNTTAYLLDSEMQPVPVGVSGELYIGGHGLASGYLNRSDLTAERFVRSPFASASTERLYRTGDLARHLPDGSIQILGRLDHQIKLRGYRIELGEIEAVILKHPSVGESTVIVREDTPGNQTLVAYLSLKDSTDKAKLLADLKSQLHSKLPEYMVPAAFVLVEKLPKTPNGKTDRKALRAPDQQDLVAAGPKTPPTSDAEKRLAAIWSHALNVPEIGRDDNFFHLGGNSLLAMNVFTEIEKEFGRHLPLATLFETPTLAGLAQLFEIPEPAQTTWSSLVPIQNRGSKPRFFCVHGAGGNLLLYRQLIANLGNDFPFYGLQSQGLDGKSNPLETIEDMARCYVEEVLAFQPSGPYYLGGYCLGGTIAFEMAQILRQRGKEVALLALFDTYNFTETVRRGRVAMMAQWVGFHINNFMRLSPSEMKQYLSEKIRLAGDGEFSARFNLRKPTPNRPSTITDGRSALKAVQSLNDYAASRYFPKPYGGRVTLFKPCVNYKMFPDPMMGWGEIALGGVEVVELPVNPHAMLVEPFVKDLASTLATKLQPPHEQNTLVDANVAQEQIVLP